MGVFRPLLVGRLLPHENELPGSPHVLPHGPLVSPGIVSIDRCQDLAVLADGETWALRALPQGLSGLTQEVEKAPHQERPLARHNLHQAQGLQRPHPLPQGGAPHAQDLAQIAFRTNRHPDDSRCVSARRTRRRPQAPKRPRPEPR